MENNLRGKVSSKQKLLTYRSKVRQLEMAAEDFANVASRRLVDGDGEPHALLDNTDLVWGDVQLPELGGDVKNSGLGHDEEVAVRVVQA